VISDLRALSSESCVPNSGRDFGLYLLVDMLVVLVIRLHAIILLVHVVRVVAAILEVTAIRIIIAHN